MTERSYNKASVVILASSALLLSACGGSGDSSEEATSDANSTQQQSEAARSSAATPEEEVATVLEAEDPVEDAIDTASDKVANVTEEVADNIEDAVADTADEIEVIDATASSGGSEYASLTGNAATGKRVFVKCMSCHTVQEGQNRVGPSLYGIVGRNAGSVEGFNYSDANANSGITWTEEIMFEYLEAPQGYMPGTRMIFPGLPVAQERADVIAYLQSVVE